ncbi:MAG: (d)CMP kinase, partial [Pseudohongiellaceae bacterium]
MSDIPVIAIDGPSGSGKGTIAGMVANRLGFVFLDSGALYRILGIAAHKANLELENHSQVADLARTLEIQF